MKYTPWRIWLLYAVGIIVAGAALSAISVTALRLERAEHEARQEAEFRSSLRFVLWRLDSWMGPLIAREAARDLSEYGSILPAQDGSGADQTALELTGDSFVSPLASFRSPFIRVHFEIHPGQRFTSPQIPIQVMPDVPVDLETATLDREQYELLLNDLQARMLAYEKFDTDIEFIEACFAGTLETESTATETPALPERQRIADRSLDEASQQSADFQWRQGVQSRNQLQANSKVNIGEWQAENRLPDEPDELGPFVPIWIPSVAPDEETEPILAFVRRVKSGGAEWQQGFVMNWARVSEDLLREARTTFPDAVLKPVLAGWPMEVAADEALATIPALLIVSPPTMAAMPGNTTTRLVLAMSWIGLLISAAAVAFSLAGGIHFARSRQRFAYAVTHELRTPLTTFRMYAEMLAGKMVPEQRQREYLSTMHGEAERLTRLIENVLSYARVEEGTTPRIAAERMTISNLLDRVCIPLNHRVGLDGYSLRIENEIGEACELTTDPDVLGQILLNLVDNACKYGASADQPMIVLEVLSESEAIQFRVGDSGPGLSPSEARRFFKRFARRDETARGIGLGLTLSRQLAKQLGGDLQYEDAPEQCGAWFVLSLPHR